MLGCGNFVGRKLLRLDWLLRLRTWVFLFLLNYLWHQNFFRYFILHYFPLLFYQFWLFLNNTLISMIFLLYCIRWVLFLYRLFLLDFRNSVVGILIGSGLSLSGQNLRILNNSSQNLNVLDLFHHTPTVSIDDQQFFPYLRLKLWHLLFLFLSFSLLLFILLVLFRICRLIIESLCGHNPCLTTYLDSLWS